MPQQLTQQLVSDTLNELILDGFEMYEWPDRWIADDLRENSKEFREFDVDDIQALVTRWRAKRGFRPVAEEI